MAPIYGLTTRITVPICGLTIVLIWLQARTNHFANMAPMHGELLGTECVELKAWALPYLLFKVFTDTAMSIV